MKKLALVICSNLILLSSYGQDLTTTPITLNGVDATTAQTMILHFHNNMSKDTKPVTTSVWFSKEMIHDIVTMLHAEITTQTAIPGTGVDATDKIIGITDGIRIYFASDPSVNTFPLKTSVLLVSTKDAGVSQLSIDQCPSQKKHKDYYDHSPTADLFKLGSINGAICNGNTTCIGDSLYINCFNCSEDANCPSLPHNITRKDAEDMVHNFKKHAFNTESEWFDLSFWETLDADTRYNGVRIYFATHSKIIGGAYPSERDALVITTTEYDKKTGANVDYFDCGIAASFLEKYNKIHSQKSFKPMMLPGQDKGELCPNNCN